MSYLTSFPDYEKFVELQPNLYRARFPLKLYGSYYPSAIFLIHIPSTKDCILVDSGDPENTTKLLEALSSHFESFSEYKLKYVAITHGHFDHTGALPKLLNDYKDAKIIMGEHEVPFVVDGKKYSEVDGDTLTYQILRRFTTESDVVLGNNKDRIVVIKEGNEREFEFYDVLRPIITVGHTPGSLSYLHTPTNYILIGDLVFNISYLPILSTKHSISIPTSNFNISESKKSVKRISNMNEVKLVFPAHDLNPNGISIEEFGKFAQQI